MFPALGQDFSAKEIKVRAADGVEMGATLTWPAKEIRPKAVLVLATGSGIQNRDEEIMGKKPFKTLAEFLSSNGFAVLRVDDRGFANPGDAEIATFDTYTDDVAAAVSLVDSLYPAIPAGIIGHSCGGAYAIRIAARNGGVDFIVTLAAPAWSGDSLIISQSRTIATQLTGRWDGEQLQRQIMAIAKSEEPDLSARERIVEAFHEFAGVTATLPQVQQQIQQQVSGILSPWYRSLLRYNPAGDIASVNIPFLALNGSKDMQVLASNLLTIKELNPKAETRLIENHNHLFQFCQTGMMQEYATLPGDFSDLTLQSILEWLNKIVK